MRGSFGYGVSAGGELGDRRGTFGGLAWGIDQAVCRARRMAAFVLAVGAGVLAGAIVAQAQAASVGTVTNYTGSSISRQIVIATGPA